MNPRRILLIGASLVVLALTTLFFAVRRGDVSPAHDVRIVDLPPSSPSAPPAKSPQAEGETVAPTTATAQITRADKSVLEIRALDGEFGRVHVEPNEVLTIRLVLKNFDSGSKVRVDADNGGCLNHRLGPLVIEPKTGDDTVAFQYAVGGHRGKYTLLVMQGSRQELLEFWVGPEPRTGQAGPVRVFHPDNT